MTEHGMRARGSVHGARTSLRQPALEYACACVAGWRGEGGAKAAVVVVVVVGGGTSECGRAAVDVENLLLHVRGRPLAPFLDEILH